MLGDQLLGQQQVVIKSLEENYDPIDGISAATILGNGKVALILDVDGLNIMAQIVADRLIGQTGNQLKNIENEIAKLKSAENLDGSDAKNTENEVAIMEKAHE